VVGKESGDIEGQGVVPLFRAHWRVVGGGGGWRCEDLGGLGEPSCGGCLELVVVQGGKGTLQEVGRGRVRGFVSLITMN
jgi:hypothetical protein